MPPLLSLSTPSLLATSLTNLSSSRHRPPSLAAQREEGWTEVWGGKDYNNKNENDESTTVEDEDAPSNKTYLPPRYIHVLNDDCDYIGATATSSTANNNGRTLLTLTQYRVAWYEQIILRMCQIPHTVENSSYAARECTGALPCLLDLNCGQVVLAATAAESKIDNQRNDENIPLVVWGNTWNSYLSRLNKPVYIGRNQPGGLGSYFFHQCQSKRKTNNTTDNNGDDDDLYPSWFMSSGSHIVDYLRMKHSSSMKHRVLFPEHLRQQQQQPPPPANNNYNSSGDDAMAYETLIQDKLNYILLALRYGNDPAWEGVYKEQCIRASLDPNNYSSSLIQKSLRQQRKSRRTFFSLWSWYQANSERALALYNLIPSKYATTTTMGCCSASMALDLFRYNDYRYGDGKGGSSLEEEDDTVGGETGATTTTETAVHHHHHHQHHPFSSMVPSYGGVGGGDSGSVNVYRAMEYADMYYTSLEQKMVVGGGGGGSATYFLGTSIPSYIDALLFSHLAEALCDVYLVLVLAKHSRLMKYFQWMYDQYFGEKYVGGGGGADAEEWVKWNNVSNSLNAFNQIPEAASLRKSGFGGQEVDGSGGMTHAINLMQELAIHCHELDEAMRDAAALRLKGGRERIVLEKQHRPIGSTLYQWLMGVEVKLWGSSRQKSQLSSADAGKSKTNDNKEDDEEGDSENAKKAMWQKHMEQVKRDRRYSDEVWISGVVVTFVGALLLSYSKSKK